MEKDLIIKALLEIGFKQLYPERSPEKLNYEGYPIEVKESDTLPSILKKVFEAGRTLKTWEVKNVLQIQ
ncbi:hypothetical protein [Chryseobacterium aureum]|uniref:hypothetical protein n=1 Tax=Chryseobacterium aureum TaxID=2497456 RepID=UPI000F8889A2|nr:hypothetical protein [Chryseobacterium aureum]